MKGFRRRAGGCLRLWVKHSEFLQSTETKSNQRYKPLLRGESKIANNSAALAQEIDLFSIRKETD